MKDFRKVSTNLAGRFHRKEWNDQFSVVECIGTVYADSLTDSEIEYIKQFYRYPASAKHEIITAIGHNGSIKIYA